MLRDYQLECVDALWENLNRHVLASLPTGSGKSHVIGEICRRVVQHHGRILVVAPSKELVAQNASKIVDAIPTIPVGIYCAGLRQKDIRHITVASIQSIYRVASQLDPFDVILPDECHLVPHGDEGMYHKLFQAMPDAKVGGLTATPYRLKGGLLHKGAERLFDDLVYEAKTSDLIAKGFLSRVRARATTDHADLSNVHIRAGEFKSDEMDHAFSDDAVLTKAAVADVIAYASSRKSIMTFCCSVEHCHKVAQAYRDVGIDSVAVVTGETPAGERDRIIRQFRQKIIRVLVNCNVLTTGFDAPNVDCIVLLRATTSPGLYVQMVGRGLRKADGKEDCLLLDYGENIERHGPLDMITAEAHTPGEGEDVVKTCPECSHKIAAGFRICPECGFVFPAPEESGPKHGVQASTKDPITGSKIDKHEVFEVRYRKHVKPDKPPSLRVDYRIGMFDWISEWVCLEHDGWARGKARRWLERRGMIDVPDTVDDVLQHCGGLIAPKTITVKAGKYPEVLTYEF